MGHTPKHFACVQVSLEWTGIPMISIVVLTIGCLLWIFKVTHAGVYLNPAFILSNVVHDLSWMMYSVEMLLILPLNLQT